MRLSLASAAILAAPLALATAAPLGAKDSLGVFGEWGAFRDPQVPLCYAITAAEPSSRPRAFDPFASVGTWPARKVRGQVHVRLSREPEKGGAIRLRLGGETFTLTGSGGNAWASDADQDAAIRAAIRSASRMSVSARDQRGNAFTDSYSLDGAATAMDAASVGCARQG